MSSQRCLRPGGSDDVLFLGLHDVHPFRPLLHHAALHLCLLHPSLCHHFLLLLYLQSHSTHNAVGTVHAHTNINTIYGYYSRRSPPVTHSHSCVNINKLAIKMNYKRGSVITVKLQVILYYRRRLSITIFTGGGRVCASQGDNKDQLRGDQRLCKEVP